jgi:hypothetical protein
VFRVPLFLVPLLPVVTLFHFFPLFPVFSTYPARLLSPSPPLESSSVALAAQTRVCARAPPLRTDFAVPALASPVSGHVGDQRVGKAVVRTEADAERRRAVERIESLKATSCEAILDREEIGRCAHGEATTL